MHPEQCRRNARFRVSEICREPSCRTAVHVHLACAECKDAWLLDARECLQSGNLRVTPL